MIKLALTTALATIAGLSATSAAAQYTKQTAPATTAQPAQPAQPGQAAAQPQIKLSKEAGNAIIELQKAVNAKDTANIPAKLAAAQALAKTPDDRYAIGQLQLRAALNAKNNEAAVQAIDYIAGANYLPKPQVAGLYNSLGVEFFNGKNSPRAIQMFQKAIALDPNNGEALRLLAEVQNASGNSADSIATFQKAMQQAKASGQKLPEDSFKRAVSAAYNAKSPLAVDLSREWVAAYPNAESWTNAIAIYRNMMRPEIEGTLDLLRLVRAAGALRSPGDFAVYAQSAANQGNFGEAQSVIDEGIAAKIIDPSSARFRETVSGLKGKPKASPAELEAAAKIAKTATAMIAVGNRFYGIGNYARSAELYRSALGAGGDAGLANLHLGMALARAGDKAGAIAALSAVTGEYAGIAKYWLLWVQQAG